MKKTAAEQSELENKVADAQETAKIERIKCGKLESQLRTLETEKQAFKMSVLSAVEEEKQNLARLKEEIISLRNAIITAVNNENERIAALEAAASQVNDKLYRRGIHVT